MLILILTSWLGLSAVASPFLGAVMAANDRQVARRGW